MKLIASFSFMYEITHVKGSSRPISLMQFYLTFSDVMHEVRISFLQNSCFSTFKRIMTDIKNNVGFYTYYSKLFRVCIYSKQVHLLHLTCIARLLLAISKLYLIQNISTLFCAFPIDMKPQFSIDYKLNKHSNFLSMYFLGINRFLFIFISRETILSIM